MDTQLITQVGIQDASEKLYKYSKTTQILETQVSSSATSGAPYSRQTYHLYPRSPTP